MKSIDWDSMCHYSIQVIRLIMWRYIVYFKLLERDILSVCLMDFLYDSQNDYYTIKCYGYLSTQSIRWYIWWRSSYVPIWVQMFLYHLYVGNYVMNKDRVNSILIFFWHISILTKWNTLKTWHCHVV